MTILHANEAAASTLSPARNPNPGNTPAQTQTPPGPGDHASNVASCLSGAQVHPWGFSGSVVPGV